jgi:UDP-N-acetylmuramoyl-tripeptide--D-alanyl-D-alanine ligase
MMQNPLDRVYELFRSGASICTDTRKPEKGCIFFALKGESFNGNKFAADAVLKGAAIAVVDEDTEGVPDNNLIRVDDVLSFLQNLAKHHRRQFNIPVIGITGSNGKTTTKELIAAVLSKTHKVLFTQGNLNNHIGVPLTLLSLKAEHDIAVIEMGANHQGEIGLLCSIAEPTHVMITNVGMAHLEGFGGFEGVKKGKGEMYEYARSNDAIVFLNSSDKDLTSMLGIHENTIRYGSRGDIISGSAIESDYGLHIRLTIGGAEHELKSALTGTYNLSNIMSSAAIGHYFEVPEQDICDAIESYTPSNSRSQVIKKGSITIIADMYNANPTSMEASLVNFGSNFRSPKAIFLGAMHELGDDSDKHHARVAELARQQEPDLLVFVGSGFRNCIRPEEHYFETISGLKELVTSIDLNGFSIFIKGSRKTSMEELLDLIP